MDVELSIRDQDIWEQRSQRLKALIWASPCLRQHVPAQPNKNMDAWLFSVAKEGDVDEFIEALEKYCATKRVLLPTVLGLRSPSENTLLHAAAESDNNVQAVIGFVPEQLISSENSRGETPLHIAARAGKTGAVELLLPQGKPRHTDCCGNTALHEAVRNCRHKVIGQLVSKDPNLLHCQNDEIKSPLCVAVETGNLEVLRVLLEAGNDGEDQRRSESEKVFGMSPVHVAILNQNMDMLTMMWQKNPWLFELRDAGDGTPLHLAAYKNYLDGVKFLMEKFPTSALEQDGMGYLPIHVACMMNYVRIVKELLQWWVDPAEFPARLGQNILHVSARYGSVATVKYILKSPKFGHLINVRDFDGNTPLHLAALYYQPTVLLLARDRRIDVKLVNKNNMTALDVVEQDIKAVDASIGKRFTRGALISAGTPGNGELAIRKPTGRSPQKRLKPAELWSLRDPMNTQAIVAALVASVTFTSGFSVPGGYNCSEGDAGMPILLHKVMYNVFVTCNSIAMYSSIMALVILLWSFACDPYMVPLAIVLSNVPMLVILATMPLAFMAGVYVTVTKLAWLSIFVLVLGFVALFAILSTFIMLFFPVGWGPPLLRRFTDLFLFWGIQISRGNPAESGTAGRAARSDPGTPDTSAPT